MTRYLLSVVFLLTIVFQPIFAQNIKKVSSSEVPPKQMFRHWSIAANGGIAIIDADLSGANKIVPNSNVNFAFNAQLEYMITPIWGLYVQYSYLPYSGIRQEVEKFQGLTHDVTLNGTFNIINLFRSNRSKSSKWGLNVNVGAGLGFYNTNLYGYNGKDYTEELSNLSVNSRTFVLPVGLSVEYAPVECLGIFLQAEYRMYQADDIDCRVQGRNNDYMGYAGIGLRYKIGANKKRGSIKTTSIMEHHPDKTDVTVMNQQEKLNDLVAKVDNVTDMLNKTVMPKIEELEKNIEDNTDTDSDGVPDYRDRHANTPAGSFVNYYGEPLTADEINKIMGAQKLQRPDATIYYEKNLAIVSPDREIAIAEIASQLYNNPEYKLEIIGYCDNSGNAEYNQKLSISRAEAIKRILVKQYNIEESRITTNGKGKTKGPKDNFIVNRRADIFIIK